MSSISHVSSLSSKKDVKILSSPEQKENKLLKNKELILAIIATLISIYILKRYVFTKDPLGRKNTNGTIVKSSCSPVDVKENDVITYRCVLQVKYNIDGKDYLQSITIDDKTKYELEQTILLLYNPEDPTQIYKREINYNKYIFIFIVILLLGGALLNFYISKK